MTLLAKIHTVRRLALTVVKTGKITGGINAQFASYPDVWSALQPELDKAGLSVGFGGAELSALNDGEKVAMVMEISDGEEIREVRFEMMVPERILNSRGSSVVNNAQRVANAESYLKRTGLIHYFGMSAGNEDECERMGPTGDQSNIPGLIRITDATNWHDLLDGVWRDAESPLHDGKLSGYAAQGSGAMVGIWGDYPNHPGLIAWAADWISDILQALGQQWSDVLAVDPSLPATMAACTGPQMRAAAAAANKLRKGGQAS